MTLIDDIDANISEKEVERRRLLALAGAGAIATAAGGTVVAGIQYIAPNVLYESESRLRVGRPEMFAPGQVLFLPQPKVYVVRGEKGFYAMSAVCTHLGCMTRYEASQRQIFCPCHGSRFQITGAVAGGPAPRPLPRLAMSIESGILVVDTRKPAPADAVLEV